MGSRFAYVIRAAAAVAAAVAITASGASAQPARGQLANRWSFDGNLADTSGNGNHGTLSSGSETYVAGKFGRAISLSGLQEVTNTAASGLPTAGTADWSMNVWARPVNMQGGAGGETLAYFGRAVGQTSSDRSIANNYGRPGVWVNFGTEFKFGAWPSDGLFHMYTVTYAGGSRTYSAYIDGVLKGTTVGGAALANAEPRIRAGGSIMGSTADKYSVALDEFTIWSGVLGQGEIVNLYKGNAPAAPAAPAGLRAVGGNALVVLNWTGSVWATGYDVKRSLTSGSGYAKIGTTSGTVYMDATAANETPYYYVVSATNGVGESAAHSSEAAATPKAGVSLDQAIRFELGPTLTRTRTDAPFPDTATASPSGVPVTYSSDNTAVARVDAHTGMVTITGVGVARIRANQAGNDRFRAASEVSQTLTVTKVTTAITWSDPAPIISGEALSGAQLDATSGGVAGTFVYTPAAGTVLPVGAGQTLSVQFTPADPGTYTTPAPEHVAIAVLPLMKQNPGPWDVGKLSIVPEATFGERKGLLQEVYYQGEPLAGKPTRVFAYYARPDGAGPFPGVVLVHGGGGKAFPEWAEMWAKRGYAALAMDLSGNGPDGQHLADGGPIEIDKIMFREFTPDQVKDMWSYHAVAAVIRGHSLLAAQKEVDARRTAVTGISWGGYLTCIVAGLDHRFKAAVPVYGCGFIYENSAWVETWFKPMSAAGRELWVRNFDPSQYLPTVQCHTLFVNGTNDFAYPLDSHRKSTALVKAPVTLSIQVGMPHGHYFADHKEVFAFIDGVLQRESPLAKIGPMQVQTDPARPGAGTVSASFQSRRPIVRAALNYAADAGAWQDRSWQSVPATIESDRVVAPLPKERPIVMFVSLFDDRGMTVTTPYQSCRPGQ